MSQGGYVFWSHRPQGLRLFLQQVLENKTLLFGDEFQNYLFPHDLGLITGEEKLNPHSREDEEIKPCRVFRIVKRKARQENRSFKSPRIIS